MTPGTFSTPGHIFTLRRNTSFIQAEQVEKEESDEEQKCHLLTLYAYSFTLLSFFNFKLLTVILLHHNIFTSLA